MTDYLMNFIRSKRINSFHKLQFLLFLYQHPTFSGTSEQFAQRLFLGDVSLIERIMNDLCAAGVLVQANQQCQLPDDQTLKLSLHNLNLAYSDPLVRQKLLNMVRSSSLS